mmetsp:Transcript_4244/g.13583  ORF Transcript_4244/g.13583 Transcript_4244/m.13583 type:complete len:261 (-) Transcript_4244:1460-2242(-)
MERRVRSSASSTRDARTRASATVSLAPFCGFDAHGDAAATRSLAMDSAAARAASASCGLWIRGGADRHSGGIDGSPLVATTASPPGLLPAAPSMCSSTPSPNCTSGRGVVPGVAGAAGSCCCCTSSRWVTSDVWSGAGSLPRWTSAAGKSSPGDTKSSSEARSLPSAALSDGSGVTEHSCGHSTRCQVPPGSVVPKVNRLPGESLLGAHRCTTLSWTQTSPAGTVGSTSRARSIAGPAATYRRREDPATHPVSAPHVTVA